MPLNLNGRICVYFSIFWGLLGIYLISYVNPRIDKLIDWAKTKLKNTHAKIIIILIIIFIFIDCIATGFALKFFIVRKVHENNIQVTNKEQIDMAYDRIYKDEKLANFIDKYWNDRKMIRTFPNLKTQDKEGNMIYFDCYVGDIQPYYYKFDFKLKNIRDRIF